MLDSVPSLIVKVVTLGQRSISTTRPPTEIERGVRFAFGANWRSFVESVDESRIGAAQQSLTSMLGREQLDGLSFLDIGSGSGLFSLAAFRLGATVMSFDYDPESVASTEQLRLTYAADDPSWRVEQGSVLDADYMASLGTFDVVYAWGVLHHTGAMWPALERAIGATAGTLFIAIYNDQGRQSRIWRRIKQRYNHAGPAGRGVLLGMAESYFRARSTLAGARSSQPRARGMSAAHDLRDWLGGYPFEVASAGEVFTFCHDRGLTLTRLRTSNGLGNNEFVFER